MLTNTHTINGIFYDGVSSLGHPVTMHIENGILYVNNAHIQHQFALNTLKPREPVEGAPRTIDLPNHAKLDLTSPQSVTWLLQHIQIKEPWAHRLSTNWQFTSLFLILIVLTLFTIQHFALPIASKYIAMQLPVHMVIKLGDETMALIDQQDFQASQLPIHQQQSLQTRFQALLDSRIDLIPVTLQIRASTHNEPNAFALPNGTIVITDDLVELIQDEEAIMGALAHELGHIQQRHNIRQALQNSLVGLMALSLFNDSSTLLAALSTTSLSATYSRAFEREADEFAIHRFERKEWPLEKLRLLHTQLAAIEQENPSLLQRWVSTHPNNQERLENIRRALIQQQGAD